MKILKGVSYLATTKTYSYDVRFRFNGVFIIWPSINLDLHHTGSNGHQIRIQRPKKHIIKAVIFVLMVFSSFDLHLNLILTLLGQMNIRFVFSDPKNI